VIPIKIRNGVKLLRAQGQSLREISRLLKLSRNAVRRILREKDGKRTLSPPCDAAILAGLEGAFKRARGNGVRVQELLAETGLNVPYSTLTRWMRQAQLREPPQRSGEYHQANLIAQFSHRPLPVSRLNHGWDVKSESNVTRSLPCALKWLREAVYRQRALEILKSEIKNSSDLPALLHMAKTDGYANARRRLR